MLNDKEISEARLWLIDCSFPDIDDAEIMNLTDAEIIKAINRHYSGGLKNFKKDIK